MDYAKEMERILAAANQAGQQYLDNHFDGKDWGCCGFAWVVIQPKHKGNTKDGKAERVTIRSMGFELDYTGKNFSLWNPSNLPCQNIDAKEVGARKAAAMLRELGFNAYSQSRLD